MKKEPSPFSLSGFCGMYQLTGDCTCGSGCGTPEFQSLRVFKAEQKKKQREYSKKRARRYLETRGKSIRDNPGVKPYRKGTTNRKKKHDT